MVFSDKAEAEKILSRLNYYRFSAYSLTLRKNNVFLLGTTFEQVHRIYDMDAALRQLVLQFAAIVETSLRSHEAYVHAKNHGPLGYRDKRYFVKEEYHAVFLKRLDKLLEDSKEQFVLHHRNDLNGIYPFWVAVEATTFDVSSKCFRNMLPEDRTEIAGYYGARRKFVENWMHCAVIARNIAAHGGRFYNRPLATKLLVPKKVQKEFPPDCAFAYLYGLYRLLESEKDKERFTTQMCNLLAEYSDVDTSYISLPERWKEILEMPI